MSDWIRRVSEGHKQVPAWCFLLWAHRGLNRTVYWPPRKWCNDDDIYLSHAPIYAEIGIVTFGVLSEAFASDVTSGPSIKVHIRLSSPRPTIPAPHKPECI